MTRRRRPDGLRCRICGQPLFAICMRCRGRAGGQAQTRRKLRAAMANLAQARAGTQPAPDLGARPEGRRARRAAPGRPDGDGPPRRPP
jgi:hypothetical protein